MFGPTSRGDSADILRRAAERAAQSGIGAYTIAVTADGRTEEVADEAALNSLIARSSSVEYKGILVDGKGGLLS